MLKPSLVILCILITGVNEVWEKEGSRAKDRTRGGGGERRWVGQRRGQGRGGVQHRFLDRCKDELQLPCPSQQKTL